MMWNVKRELLLEHDHETDLMEIASKPSRFKGW